MARPTLSGTGFVWLQCFAVGAVFAAAAGYAFPEMKWTGYPVIVLVIALIAYPQVLQLTANEQIIDRGDWPTKTKAPKKNKPPEE